MHDIKVIRDDPEGFDKGLALRGLDPQAAKLIALDKERRAHVAELQEAQSRRNAASKQIGAAKAKGDDKKAQALIDEVAELKSAIQAGEEEERRLDRALEEALAELPNLPLAGVPVGPDETANQELRRWGEPPKLAFEPRQHFELGEALGLMDFDTAARISGARFVVLKGALARLERALAAFMLELHTSEFGYTEMSPPVLVRPHAMFGTGQLPKFEQDLFKATNLDAKSLASAIWADLEAIQSGRAAMVASTPEPLMKLEIENALRDLEGDMRFLIPTAEVPLTNLARETILEADALPLRVTACTPCFRAEAGAAGKDTRGMIRQHQFAKVELVSITRPEQGLDEHERMTGCAEEVLKRLGLPYRVVVLSTGDMGFSAAKTYDVEVWLPGQNTYREISSCSYCGDFQARRMNARFRPGEGEPPQFVHTLNGSGLAVGRTLIAVMENCQQADGSIVIPEALRPHMGGLEVIGAG